MIYFQIGVIFLALGLAAALVAVVFQAGGGDADASPSKTRSTAGNALLYLTAFVFLASGISKLVHVPLAVTEMTLLGLTGGKYVLVALMEITGGLLLLAPPLRALALLYVSAHMGGAICAHLIADQYFAILPSLSILGLAWLGMFLRHPQSLWSLRGDGRRQEVLRSASLPSAAR